MRLYARWILFSTVSPKESYGWQMEQHIIPQFYLREFRDTTADRRRGPHVWVADLLRGTVELRSPRGIAKRTDYYTVQGTDGTADHFFEVEILRLVEDAVAPVFAKFRTEQYRLTTEERVKLTEFIALLSTRIPGWRDEMQKIAGDVAQGWIRVAARHPDYFERRVRMANEGIDFSSERIEEIRRSALDPNAFEYRGTPDLSLQLMLDAAARLAPFLYGMAWVFVAPPPERHFITCDNPAHWDDPTTAPPFDRALLRRKTVLTLSINPHACLLAAWRNHLPDSAQADEALVECVNERTIRVAERFVFAARRCDAEKALAMRRGIEERGGPVGYQARKVLILRGRPVDTRSVIPQLCPAGGYPGPFKNTAF